MIWHQDFSNLPMDCIKKSQAWTEILIEHSIQQIFYCWGAGDRAHKNVALLWLPSSPETQTSTKSPRSGAPLPSRTAYHCSQMLPGSSDRWNPKSTWPHQVSIPSKTQASPEGLILLHRNQMKLMQPQIPKTKLRHCRSMLTTLLQVIWQHFCIPECSLLTPFWWNSWLLKSTPTDLSGSQVLPAVIWRKITKKKLSQAWNNCCKPAMECGYLHARFIRIIIF